MIFRVCRSSDMSAIKESVVAVKRPFSLSQSGASINDDAFSTVREAKQREKQIKTALKSESK
jgi:hypothetical protein